MFFYGPDSSDAKQYIEYDKSIKNGFSSVHVINNT